MKHIYLYLWIHWISQFGIGFHGVQSMILKKGEEEASHLPSTSSELYHDQVHDHSKELIDQGSESLEGTSGKENLHKQHSAEYLKYRTDKAEKFWETVNIEGHEHFGENNYKPLIGQINEVLLSEEGTWVEKLNDLFEKTEQNAPEQAVLFYTLKEISNFYELPYKVILAVWYQLRRVWYETGNPLWKRHANLALDAYDEKMIAQVISLKPAKEFIDFVVAQREMGCYGVRLAGNWSQEDQKALFVFWLSNPSLYSRMERSASTDLQRVLETQIVQTRLIQAVQDCPDGLPPLQEADQDCWRNKAQSMLISQSQIILDYIESIENSDLEPGQRHLRAAQFTSAQERVKPFGLELDPLWKEQNQMKIMNIIKFWSSYVQVFLKMKNLRETVSLGIVIGNLVKENYIEMSSIMKEFLNYEDGGHPPKTIPILAQFLEYFSRKTQIQKQSEEALAGLRSLRIENQHEV